MGKKFDQYEIVRKETENIIDNLLEKVSRISNKLEALKVSLDRQQQ